MHPGILAYSFVGAYFLGKIVTKILTEEDSDNLFYKAEKKNEEWTKEARTKAQYTRNTRVNLLTVAVRKCLLEDFRDIPHPVQVHVVQDRASDHIIVGVKIQDRTWKTRLIPNMEEIMIDCDYIDNKLAAFANHITKEVMLQY